MRWWRTESSLGRIEFYCDDSAQRVARRHLLHQSAAPGTYEVTVRSDDAGAWVFVLRHSRPKREPWAAVLSLAMLTGCALQTGGTGDVRKHEFVLPEADHTIESPPWLEAPLPFKVSLDEAMGEGAVVAALQAVSDVNDAAGGELLRVTDYELANVHVGLGYLRPGSSMWTGCWGASVEGPAHCETIVTLEKLALSDAIGMTTAYFTHEFLHTLGYAAVDGDAHDAGGTLMGRVCGDTEMSDRMVEHLRWLAESW